MKHYLVILILLFLNLPAYSIEQANNTEQVKYPNYGDMYLGNDKFEKFNRKMFKTNIFLHKYALYPVTVIWASVMPKYGMDRIKSAYENFLYPRRLVSTILQRDFKGARNATVRFLTNTTIGLGGMFDPAKKLFKMGPIDENMDQALAKLKIKSGPYLVIPILNATTPRGIVGYGMDTALDPTTYVGLYAIAAVKAAMSVNNATMYQGGIKTILNNYVDPYDITRKAYGLNSAILNSNLDRDYVIEEKVLGKVKENKEEIVDIGEFDYTNGEESERIIASAATNQIKYKKGDLVPDIILKNYYPQHPVIDSMRTALFNIEGVDKSIWSEDSIWNRSFKNRIKTGEVQVTDGRDKYEFNYILQKDKNSPLAIIYPSIGEGIDTHHSIHFAKLFYDEGYSVVILGSAFHFNFYNSMPSDYRPGLPLNDAKYLRLTTSKIIEYVEKKHKCEFTERVLLGTSFGAVTALNVGNLEDKENTLHLNKIISINPPIELIYAMNEIDKNSEDWNNDKGNIKEKTTMTAAKVVKKVKDDDKASAFADLPFDPDEAKMIVGFIMHQKLSDLIYAIEGVKPGEHKEFYKTMQNIGYKDYAQKYLVGNEFKSIQSFSNQATLYNIKPYLKKGNNYRIYFSMDDYLTNETQLKNLRKITGGKTTLIDKGSHLGFLYREEFLEDLKSEISLKKDEAN